jgi:hypothetical protein
VKRAYNDAQAGRYQMAADRIRIIRVALAKFGSHESQVLVAALDQIERDVSDRLRFAQRAGEMHATASSIGTRRPSTTTGAYIAAAEYMTSVQALSAEDMKHGEQPSTPEPKST